MEEERRGCLLDWAAIVHAGDRSKDERWGASGKIEGAGREAGRGHGAGGKWQCK